MQMLTKLHEILSTHTTHNQESTQTGLTIDTALHILSDARRRRLIDYLCTHDRNTSVRALSESLADEEASDRKTLYIALYQNHLPALNEADIVDWDQRAGTVTATANCTALHDLQTQVLDHLEP